MLTIATLILIAVIVLFACALVELVIHRNGDEFVGYLTVLTLLVAMDVIMACAYSAAAYPASPRTETVTVEKVGEDGKVVVVHDVRYVPVYGWYSPWYWYCGPYGHYGPVVVYHDHFHYGPSGIYRSVPANRVVTVNKTVNVNHNHTHVNAPAPKPATPNVKPASAPKFNSGFKPVSGGFKPSGGGFRSGGGSRGRR